jgi:acetoin utilization protein AcuB
MPIQSIMTANPVTIRPDANLAEARELLKRYGIHHLLVVSDQRVMGLLTEGDILLNVSPYADTPAETARDKFTLHKKVHQVMHRRPPTVTPDAPVAAAASIILEHDVSCVPVVNDQEELVGIVSWKDLLRFALKK